MEVDHVGGVSKLSLQFIFAQEDFLVEVKNSMPVIIVLETKVAVSKSLQETKHKILSI